ncbi:MAG: hypothetical protein Q8M16_04950 [Pirellulaceae bacterium]|nr:hypothetical protein [Pirellulaceae bacterium]
MTPLRYLDFVPRQVKAPGLITEGRYENFDAAVEAANRWLDEQRVQLLQLETVVLPNLWNDWEEGTKDGSISTSGDAPSRWHQFLRIWYQPVPDSTQTIN